MKKILLIEDNLEMRENTSEILDLAGYVMVVAENGKQGVEMAKKEKPDLIISDIMMPDLDGYGVLHILSKDPDTAGIPFIFLTAKADRGDMRKGMNMGADDYLTKPFEETELLNAIETRLKRNEFFRKSYSRDLGGFVQFINEAKQFSLPENITAEYKVRNWTKKSSIYHEGDMPNMVYLVNKGKVKTWKMSPEGKEFITGIYNPGEFFGYISILEGIEHSDSATALEDAEVALVPQTDFLALIYSNSDVSARFVKMLANDISEKEERLLGLAYNSVRARAAGALLQLQKKYNDNNSIRISREDLAGIVGTSTESLIRALSEFKSEKLIETDGREIKVLSTSGLEKARKFS
ncbi:MAG TPA: response regulator [Bacteroidia bacterium]|jgi:CheY-like chemotaxis protein/CRP-like cAMP-binding protein|nr:response regulator [Bacteroidia bacterium]